MTTTNEISGVDDGAIRRWLAPGVAALAGLFALIGVFAAIGWNAPAADAQGPCAGVFVGVPPAATVTTTAELDQAIACYNTATTAAAHTIALDAALFDYGAALGATPITQAGVGFSLTIDGAGNTIRGTGGTAGTVGVVDVGAGAAPVTVQDLRLEATGDAFANGLFSEGTDTTLLASTIDGGGSAGNGVRIDAGSLNVTNSTITNTGSGNGGLRAEGGSATVTNSTITNTGTEGITVAGGSVSVTNSTITDTGTGGIVLFGGSVTVTNSTITNTGTAGIAVFGGSVTVTNSTITDTGAAGIFLDDIGSVAVTNSTITNTGGAGISNSFGSVSVDSSVVEAGCFGVSGSNNFVGSGPGVSACGTSTVLTGGVLPPAANNGCGVQVGVGGSGGCVLTVALPAGSNAVNGGGATCTATAAGVDTDNRGAGFDRVEVGACDAGAFELAGSPLSITKSVAGAVPFGADFGFVVSSAPGSPDGCGVLSQPLSLSAAGTVEASVVASVGGVACTYVVAETITGAANCVFVSALPEAATVESGVAVLNACPSARVLTITKTWVGPKVDTSFTIAGRDASCTVSDANPTITATVAGGQVSVATVDVSTVDGQPCTYTVTETVPAGYSPTPASGVASGIAADGDVVFVNQLDPVEVSFTITKTWIGADPATAVSFEVAPDVAGCAATQTVATDPASDQVTVTVIDISATTAAGCTYTVTETVPAGYAVTSPASGAVTAVAPGDTVEFVNLQQPDDDEIAITKNWIGDDPGSAVSFTVTPDVTGCAATQTVATDPATDTVMAAVTDVATGTATPCTYTITETTPAGYAVTTPASGEATDVAPGDTVEFVNAQQPTEAEVIITKTWIGADPGSAVSFTVASGQPGCAGIVAQDPANPNRYIATVADLTNDNTATPCVYTVTESVPAGYELTAPATGSHTNVAPGAQIEFTNTQLPTDTQIRIDKTWNGTPVDIVFTVAAQTQGCTGTTAPLTAGDTSTTATVTDVAAGTATPCTYTITETVPAGYTSTPTDGHTGIAPGATIEFVNTQLPTDTQIRINKTWNGNPANTSFTITPDVASCTPTQTVDLAQGDTSIVATVTDVATTTAAPCAYTVTETVPAGYTSTPTDGHTGIAPGATVTFTNTQLPTDTQIRINKTWNGNPANTSFTITPDVAGCTATQTVDLAQGDTSIVATVADLATTTATPCTYTVTETALAGFQTEPANGHSNTAPGATVEFVNTQQTTAEPFYQLTIDDPIACGGTFNGTITGATPPHTITYTLTTPTQTINAGTHTAPNNGPFTTNLPNYTTVPNGTYRVTATATSTDGYYTNTTFTTPITNHCPPNTKPLNTTPATTATEPATAAATGATTTPLAQTGTTTTNTLQIALFLIGTGATAFVIRRQRNI